VNTVFVGFPEPDPVWVYVKLARDALGHLGAWLAQPSHPEPDAGLRHAERSGEVCLSHAKAVQGVGDVARVAGQGLH
jgi:hypothetical protein